MAGVVLDPWQRLVLDVSLGERADGSWAAKTVDLLASRQNGKNVVIEARELYGAVILGEQVMHTAHLFATARKSFKRIKDLLKAHPDLQAKMVRKLESPASGYSFEFASGGVIEFIARSTSSGRGFTGDLLILDEAQDLSDGALGALVPALSATSVEGDPQVWYTGSAPNEFSTVWQRRRKAGRNGGSASSAYFEFSADPESDLDDRDAWAQANPGLNVRISEDFIDDTERSSMSDEMFARERLSISPETSDFGGVFTEEKWRAACDSAAEASREPGIVFAFDVNPERSAAGIVAVDSEPTVEVIDFRVGTGWLVERIVDLHNKYAAPFVLDKNGPAGAFIDELEHLGVKLQTLDGTEVVRACGKFFDLVVEPAVTVRTNSDLDKAVAGAAKRPVGDSFAWGRKSSASDISLLVAATVGVWVQSSPETELVPWVA